MNNNHRITLNTNKNIIIEFTNERIIPASGLTVVGALLGKSGFIKKLNRMDITSNRSQHQIKNGILYSLIFECFAWASLTLKLSMKWTMTRTFTKPLLASPGAFLQKRHCVSVWMISVIPFARLFLSRMLKCSLQTKYNRQLLQMVLFR